MAFSTEHYKGNALNNILDSKIYENRCNKKNVLIQIIGVLYRYLS